MSRIEIKVPIEVSMKPSAQNLQRFAMAIIKHRGTVCDSSEEESSGLVNIMVAVRVETYLRFMEELQPNNRTMFVERMEAVKGSKS